MATRKHILHIGKWFTLALMLGSILSPTVSLANTVESKAAPQESTEATLQTLSSDSLIPESSTESTSAAETTANSDITTTENTSSGEVEPTIIQGAATIDENKLSIHEDQKNPQPSIKDQKIEQKEKHVYFSGKLFAGEDTDNGKSQTTVSYFALQSKVASNEWQTKREWLKEETSVSEQPFTFDTEVLLEKNQTYTFRYVLQYKIQKEDQDQHSIEEKTDQGYFELSNEYVYQSKEIIADPEKENSKTEKTTDATKVAEEKETKIPEETKISESTTPSEKTSVGTSANDQVIERDDIPEPKQQEQTKSRSSSLLLRGIEIKPMSHYYDTFEDELSNMRGESGSMTTGIYGYEGHFTKTSDNSVSVNGQLIGDRVTHSDGSLAWERLVQGIFILYREQGSSTWIKGTQVWSGSKANEWISYSGTHTGLQLGKTYEFAVGVNFFHNGQRPSFWPTLELSGWFGATTGGTIPFPIPRDPSVDKVKVTKIGDNTATFDYQVDYGSKVSNGALRLEYSTSGSGPWTALSLRENGNTNISPGITGSSFPSSGAGNVHFKYTGFTPNTKYWVRGVTITADGTKRVEGAATTFMTVYAGNVAISKIGKDTAIFNYTVNNGYNDGAAIANYSYRIEYSTDGVNFNKFFSVNGSGVSNASYPANGSGSVKLKYTGFTENTKYWVRGVVVPDDGSAAYKSSSVAVFITAYAGKVDISKVGRDTATFSYDVNNGYNNGVAISNVSYRIEYSTDGVNFNSFFTTSGGGVSNVSYPNNGSGTVKIKYTGFSENTKYWVRGVLVNADDSSVAWKGESTNFITVGVSAVSASNIGTDTVTLSYPVNNGYKNSTGISNTSYRIEYSTDGVTWGPMINITAGQPGATNITYPTNGSGTVKVTFNGFTENTTYWTRGVLVNTDDPTIAWKGPVSNFKTNFIVKEEFYDLSGNSIKNNSVGVKQGQSYIPTPPTSFTHSSQAYIYQGWLGESDWNGVAPVPILSLKTGPVDPLTAHGQKVYLIYDLDSNSLRLDNYPNKFDFGDQHDLQTYNQIFDLDSSKYSSTEITDGFKVRVRDDRATHPGWHLTTNFSKMKGVSNPSDELFGAKISFGVDLKEIQNPGTISETPISPGPNAPAINSGILSGNTAVLPADGNTKNFLQAVNTKGEGVWDVLIDFDSVKLFVPAGQGAIGEKYQGTIQWDLEDTP